MNKNSLIVGSFGIILLTSSSFSLAFDNKGTWGEPKDCDFGGGTMGTCSFMEDCLLDGGVPTADSGYALCCYSNGFCEGEPEDINGKPVLDPTKNTVKPTAGVYIAAPPSIRDQMRWKKSAHALPVKAVSIHKKGPSVKHVNSKRPLASNLRIKAVNK